MIGFTWERIQNRIAYRLALWVIVFSIATTLLTSGIQLYLAFKQDLRSIHEYFQSVTGMQLDSLSRSAWIMDDNQIQTHLNGITQGRDIIYAAVSVDGRPQWFSGAITTDDTLRARHALTYVQRNVVFQLGTLEIVASLEGLYDRLGSTALAILLTNALKTFLFAGCILFFFQFAVTRHLEKLASHVVNMDFRHKLKPLNLNRDDRDRRGEGDEFTRVVDMLNIFQRRGYHAFHALEKSEERLRLFFDATEEGIFGINSEGMITFANTSCLKMIGIRGARGIIGNSVTSIFHYESRSEGDDRRGVFLRSIKTGRSLISEDGFFKVKNGPGFYAALRIYPILSGNESTGAVVFFNDVTEQRKVLREKNLLSQAVRQSPLLVMITDESSIVEYVNPGFEQMTGYHLEEVVGKKTYSLSLYRKNIDLFREIRSTLSRGGKWQGIYSLRAKDGSEWSFDAMVSPVFSTDGRMINIIALSLDITQKLALQNQLHQAQKMEAVGRLSASFAHEFGNPLFGVRSVIKDISERIPMDDGDRQLLKLAHSECERMKILIHDFQRLQSDKSDAKENYDIHVILDNVLFFYKKHLQNNNIQLQRYYGENIPEFYINKNQIAQVFLNLFINALDSMSSTGGLLEVSTRFLKDEVFIDVRDTGVGISEEHRDLIFEPFYTTKTEVQGTGLGLSVSYGIISGHGGDITVTSQINA
ncbi:MAG TPA: PAS domain S-box protein, partial [Desulfopila sp.]|nr:PAS domain S-box protein [Desulfopila sp.]